MKKISKEKFTLTHQFNIFYDDKKKLLDITSWNITVELCLKTQERIFLMKLGIFDFPKLLPSLNFDYTVLMKFRQSKHAFFTISVIMNFNAYYIEDSNGATPFFMVCVK